MRVFYEDRQTERCGTPFAVGDEVAWSPVAYDAEGLRQGHGYGAGAWVENHGGRDQETVGRVRGIELVHQEYPARTDQRALARIDRAREAAGAESREVIVLPSPDRREPVPGAHTLEVADGTPPQPGDHR
ncbi:hypothetical protein BFF78_29895 [Streptomyces fodineus]|uniref:Uncharacterized protein n=2 Tax=Streptomyces fodineus TaxID=1904616 RepID=A0A1D7YGP5_9ACTN|nr:hypothetical protein BFF78_29895 [Streptomyces fodineus]